SHQDDSALRPSGHVDLSRRIEVPIRRRWHHLQKSRDLPADSLIDRSERLLLLNPVLQINPKRWGRKAKAGLGIRITAGTPDRSNSTQLGVLNLHSVQFQVIGDGVNTQIQTQTAKKPRFLPKHDSPYIGM